MENLDAFRLDPTIPVLADRLNGCVLGVLDPLYARYVTNSEDSTTFERSILVARSTPRQTMSELIESFTGDGVRGLPKSVFRGDWPFVERQIVRVLVELVWTARLLAGADDVATVHCEQILAAFCKKVQCMPALERLLDSSDLRVQAESTMELIEAALNFIHQKAGAITVPSEEWFREAGVQGRTHRRFICRARQAGRAERSGSNVLLYGNSDTRDAKGVFCPRRLQSNRKYNSL